MQTDADSLPSADQARTVDAECPMEPELAGRKPALNKVASGALLLALAAFLFWCFTFAPSLGAKVATMFCGIVNMVLGGVYICDGVSCAAPHAKGTSQPLKQTRARRCTFLGIVFVACAASFFWCAAETPPDSKFAPVIAGSAYMVMGGAIIYRNVSMLHAG